MSGPYSYLGLKFFPLGGITEENMEEYAHMDNVVAIGGTWIAKKDLILAHDWDEITRRAKNAISRWRGFGR